MIDVNKDILNQVNEGIVICSKGLKIEFFNDAAKKLLGDLVNGVTKVEGLKQDVLKYKSDGITLFKENELPMNRALAGEFVFDEEVLIVYQNHVGPPIWCSINASPIKDEESNIIGGLITIRDLGERKKNMYQIKLLNGKLEESNKKLVEKNIELEDFAARLAHDLKAPLNPIIGLIDLLRTDFKTVLNTDQAKALNLIFDSAMSMSNLITELLDYSQLENDKDRVESVSFNEVFNEIIKLLETSLEDVKGEVKVSNLPSVYCDKVPIKQLFQNIISNSIKYKKENVPPQIEVSCVPAKSDEEYLTIVIKDNGVGFNNEDASKLFQPMYRLKNPTVQGHGLGLAISAKAAMLEGWSITATGKENEGAEFKVKIPIEKVELLPVSKAS